MSIRSRKYIWSADGEPQRLPQSAFERGKNKKRFPQFASTRQKYVEALFWLDGDKISWSANGYCLDFDGEGYVSLEASGEAALQMIRAESAAKLEKLESVPRIDVIRDAKKRRDDYDAEHRWILTDADLDKVRADLTGRESIPLMKRKAR
jgi:hypothetical protein